MPGRDLLQVAADVGKTLRPAHAERLAAKLAKASSPHAAQHLVTLIPATAFHDSTQRLLDAWDKDPDVPGLAVGAAVAAAAHAHDNGRRANHLDLVVSGPTSTVLHARRTEQVLLQLISEAHREILLITYALHMYDDLHTALAAALARGVEITVLTEDQDDDQHFHGDPVKALEGLAVHRLRWPAGKRPAAGAALHGKAVIIDRSIALITSANMTRRAAGDNLEVGMLIRSGDIPQRLGAHVQSLLQQHTLIKA